MRNLLFIIVIFGGVQLLAQKDKFNLSDDYYKITIDKTTPDEVKKLFGKPNYTTNGKRSKNCMKTEYPIKKFYYTDLGFEICFHRTKENSTYRISWIYLLEQFNIFMGQTIKMGLSDYDTVLKELGNPTYKNNIGMLMLQYDEVKNGRTYVLNFDPTTRILDDIGITCRTQNGLLLW